MKGKKHTPELVEKVKVALCVSNNASQIAKDNSLNESTVRVWKKKYQEEIAVAYELKKQEFSNKAWEGIDLATRLANKSMTRALEQAEKLDMLIDVIENIGDMTEKEKMNLVRKVREMQNIPLGQLSTYAGTMYDKQALANGDSTSNVKVETIEDKLAEVLLKKMEES